MDVEKCKSYIGGESVKDLIDSNASSGSGSGVPLLVNIALFSTLFNDGCV